MANSSMMGGGGSGSGGSGGDTNLVQFDQNLIDNIDIHVNGANTFKIEFQFPPRIKTDSKSSNWEEVNTAAYEPIKIYWSSEARKFGLEWDYIASSNIFTPKKIHDICASIRGYFYHANVGNSGQKGGKYSVVEIRKLYSIIENTSPPASFRLHNFSVTYSDTIVGTNKEYWPLKTTCTMDLELVTQICNIEGGFSGGATQGAGGGKNAKLNIKQLPPTPVPAWW